mgnify:CR=1 FL=1
MCEATKITAAARGVCLSPGYGMAVGPFDPFQAAASGNRWRDVATWTHTVPGRCEALLSLRFAAFSRLSTQVVEASDALGDSILRREHEAAGSGLLRARVSVTRKKARASKSFVVGPGGVDVFGSGLRVTLLAPPTMMTEANAEYPVRPSGLGALEEAWVPLLGEDGASLRPRARVHTYCAANVPAPVPPSAMRYTALVEAGAVVRLSSGTGSIVAAPSGPVCGYQRIEVDRDAVVAWEVEP